MAQVPYTGVPEVAPQDIGVSGPHVDAPLAAFGGETGRAMSSLGTVVERAGDTLFGRAMALQNLNNETEAREADAQYMIEAGKLHADYNALQGRDRVTAFPKYQQDLQESRQRIRGSLSNPMAMKMYDGSSLSTMGRSIFNGAGAAAAANKEWSIGTAKSLLELDLKSIEDNPKDEGLFQDKLRRVEGSARSLAAQQGMEGPQEDLIVAKARSSAWAARITGQAKIEPFTAQTELVKHKNEMLQNDYLRVDQTVRAQGRAVGASGIADSVFDPTKTLKDMEAEVKEKAKKLNPEDPLLVDHAISNLRTKYNQANYAENREHLAAVQGAADLITQYKPRNLQEFLQIPGAEAHYQHMRPTDRDALPGRIDRYISSVDKYDNSIEYMRMKGMANSDDPAARMEFLNTDVTRSKLSQPQMDNLLTLQRKLKDKTSADPRVVQASTWMRGAFGAQMETLGVYRRTEANKTEYDHYQGALQSALDAWQESHGKPATYKDVTDTIGPQILRERTEPAWFGLSTRKTPFFTQEVPENFATKARQIAKDPNMSNEAVYKLWIKMQLQDLYSKAPKTQDRAQ